MNKWIQKHQDEVSANRAQGIVPFKSKGPIIHIKSGYGVSFELKDGFYPYGVSVLDPGPYDAKEVEQKEVPQMKQMKLEEAKLKIMLEQPQGIFFRAKEPDRKVQVIDCTDPAEEKRFMELVKKQLSRKKK